MAVEAAAQEQAGLKLLPHGFRHPSAEPKTAATDPAKESAAFAKAVGLPKPPSTPPAGWCYKAKTSGATKPSSTQPKTKTVGPPKPPSISPPKFLWQGPRACPPRL